MSSIQLVNVCPNAFHGSVFHETSRQQRSTFLRSGMLTTVQSLSLPRVSGQTTAIQSNKSSTANQDWIAAHLTASSGISCSR